MNINNYNEIFEKFTDLDALLNDYINYGDDKEITKRNKIIYIRELIKTEALKMCIELVDMSYLVVDM
jgi:hypothetical protein